MNETIEVGLFMCPNCGTRYMKKTSCGNYECRNLEKVPITRKITVKDLLATLAEEKKKIEEL